jgi:hypothetical protein
MRDAFEGVEAPPSDKQIDFLASLMRRRGEPASAVLDEHGALDIRRAGQAIADRKEGGS